MIIHLDTFNGCLKGNINDWHHIYFHARLATHLFSLLENAWASRWETKLGNGFSRNLTLYTNWNWWNLNSRSKGCHWLERRYWQNKWNQPLIQKLLSLDRFVLLLLCWILCDGHLVIYASNIISNNHKDILWSHREQMENI
jgi:hypothetical protein